MASLQKVQEKFDSEALEDFGKSLICGRCKRPPRPGTKVYVSGSECAKRCHVYLGKSQIFDCCSICEDGHKFESNDALTKFVSLFKLYNYLYLKNGCQEELETNSLEAHERICLFRDVTCPKLDCNANFAFNGVLDHYQGVHSNAKTYDKVLEFKGNLEDLKKNNFVLNCYGKPFYPQFYVKEYVLHCWIIGHGDKVEINSFKANLKIYIEGRSLLLQDFVKSIDIDKNLLTSGQDGMAIPVKILTEYYDAQSNEFKNQEFIELQMKVVSEKMDEIAKDENVESGVEDSESEEK